MEDKYVDLKTIKAILKLMGKIDYDENILVNCPRCDFQCISHPIHIKFRIVGNTVEAISELCKNCKKKIKEKKSKTCWHGAISF